MRDAQHRERPTRPHRAGASRPPFGSGAKRAILKVVLNGWITMANKYELQIEAERFIHNDLSNTAHHFTKVVKEKHETENTGGVALDTMAGLIFSAFSIEAKLNFVGWRVLEDDWPERANFFKKLKRLYDALGLDFDKESEPLPTISRLLEFRNTLAHGKPEIVKQHKQVADVEPEIWAALSGQWEADVSLDFLEKCRAAEKSLWDTLLEAAGIDIYDTLTRGNQCLTKLFDSV